MEDENTGSDATVETPEVQPGTQVDAKDGGETTTPEEVAQVLKGAGIDLPKESETEEENAEEDADAQETESDNESDAEESTDGDTDTTNSVEEDGTDKVVEADTTTNTQDFTLQVEDASGVTHKIEKIEDLPEDFEPKNNRQIIEIISNLQKLEGDKAKYETEQAEAAKTAEIAERSTKIQEGWQDEIKQLQADKRIPTTTKGVDNERVSEVYEFMKTENDNRMKAGRPTIGSFEDALDKLENKEAREAKVEKAKDDKETARKNGGLVGGSSAPSSTQAPVYKSGTARNANEAIRKMGLIS